MKIKLFYIIFCLIAFTSVNAQERDSLLSDEYVIPFESLQRKDKMKFQFSTGAQMSYSNTYGSSASIIYSPNINYLVSPKLIVGGGITYIQSDLTNFRPIYDLRFQPFTGNISQYYSHVTAKYKLNEKLIIGGSVFYNMAQLSSSTFGVNQKIREIDRIGYAASFEYKVNDNVSVFGEIRINDNSRNGFGYYPTNFQGIGSNSFMGQSSFQDFYTPGR